jgi:Protein of unknown function (DUF1559)
MMARRITALVVVFLTVVLFSGAFVTWIVRTRADADRMGSLNNLRELGQFAAEYRTAIEKKRKPDLTVVPPATVFRPNAPPEIRVSWVYPMLPLMNQRRQNTEPLLKQIDPGQPWDAVGNREAGQIPVKVLLCPAMVPKIPKGDQAVTQYVGIAGLGADAASLPLDSPRAGAFRYDTPTSLSDFPDGLSQTLLFGESNYQLGPWIRGGPSTVRGLLDEPKLLGIGGQFGGMHDGGTHFGMADGGAKFLRDTIEAKILKALATRNGGREEAESITD